MDFRLKTLSESRKPLFYIQKPAVFEYKKVKFPDLGDSGENDERCCRKNFMG
jgi:hypothetical protein